MMDNWTIARPQEGTDETRTDSLAEAAERYAKMGIPVFPVFEPTASGGCSCGDDGCSSRGKHPRIGRGHNAASRDLRKVRDWWTRWPNANVGLRTGPEAGIWVLDIDTKDGAVTLAQIIELYGPFEGVETATTGSGGTHVYFAWSGHPIGCSVGVLTGVDVRGEGGYVVAPPSLHVSGGRYEWRQA
jgi:putative DNA primase/helicase